MAYNPRFPYTLKVLRPDLDENGDPVFDADANPSYHAVTFAVAEYSGRLPKRGKTGCSCTGDGVLCTKELGYIPFGYRRQNATASVYGDVVTVGMMLACPLVIGEIRTGDLLELTDDDRTFRAEVVRKMNTNFGTNIWYNEVKQ